MSRLHPEAGLATDGRDPQTTANLLTSIDLFCGCGGFTLGMERAGFQTLAAIDFNPQAVATFRQNLPHVTQALERDLTVFQPAELAGVIGTDTVDVIVGGPPCQGFSKARMRDGANHGVNRLVEDSRRYLYQRFLAYVEYFQPRMFVMENVLGIKSAAGGGFFTRVQAEARALGYRVHGEEVCAWRHGVPQKRIRQLIIGTRQELPIFTGLRFMPPRFAAPGDDCSGELPPAVALGDAIGDLPILRAGGGEDERDYDPERRKRHLEDRGSTARHYLFEVLDVGRTAKLTNHVARPHNDRDLGDFQRLNEGESSAAAMRRGVKFDYPYSKEHFKDRYTKQHRDRLCSTIVAHLSKDGLMFIHPTQNRSLTPREAARIQSFPDWFRFPAGRIHAYRLIGNAVPPLVGEAVGKAVKEYLSETSCRTGRGASQGARTCQTKSLLGNIELSALPAKRAEAIRELNSLAGLDRRGLRTLPTSEFLRGWHALLFLFPDLHPDNALDHGTTAAALAVQQRLLPNTDALSGSRYIRSGWPVALELIGREAWRRHEHSQIDRSSFYGWASPCISSCPGS